MIDKTITLENAIRNLHDGQTVMETVIEKTGAPLMVPDRELPQF